MNRELHVFHDNNSTFADYSRQAKNYMKDAFVLDLVNAEDYLYIGLHKPFYRLYFDFSVKNTTANTLDVEYYNGAWGNVSRFEDDTVGATRHGFLTWEIDGADWATTEINSQSAYWVRIKPSADWIATTKLNGINLIFADDTDLEEKYLNIGQLLDEDEATFINFHQGAKNDIIQDLRNSGKVVVKTNGVLEDLTIWDLHRPEQLRSAGAYKALSLIFCEASNQIDDKYWQLHQKYENMYKNAFATYLLSYDKDDDGKEDIEETNKVTMTRIFRV